MLVMGGINNIQKDSNIASMFSINRNLRAELNFSHYNMDRLQNDQNILKRLKQKVEGKCLPEYGYILQVTKNPHAKSACGIEIGVPKIDPTGCIVTVIFSAISFKPEKNDIIDVIVTEIGETWIKGKIGHAQVLIPRSKMPETECEYRANENVYIFRDELKIDKQSRVRCKVVEIEIELNYQMKLICSIDQSIIDSMAEV